MKKFLSCLLTAVFLFCAVAPCIAMAAQESVPIIYVPGFMSTDIYKDVNDPDKGLAWPPATDDILDLVKQSLPALARYAIDRNADRLCDDVIPRVNALFDEIELDAEGNPKYNTGAIFNYPAADKVKKGGTYTFRYDWRIDPLLIAEQLNDFIEYVCESAGSEKVSIQCHSLGGVVTTTYATIYGIQRLKNVVFNAAATYGESFNGGLLSGEMTLCSDAVVKYMRYAFNENEYEKLLNGIFEMLGKAGLLDLLCDSGNRILEDLSPRAVPESIAPLFAGWLTIWSMVPDEFIDSAMKYVFQDVYTDDSHDVLKGKVEAFNTLARPYKTQTLQALNEAANVYVIARYGWSSMPATPYYNSQTDGTVDLKYSSFGATCAEYEQTLPEDYIAAADAKYISPDKSVDASTCLFPEQTWFIRNMPHSTDTAGLRNLINTLLKTDGQETVDTVEGYSRFMVKDGDALSADPGPEVKQSFLDKIKAFFQRIFDFFKNLFQR